MNENYFHISDTLENKVYKRLCDCIAPRYIMQDVRLFGQGGDIDLLISNNDQRLFAIEVKTARCINTETFNKVLNLYKKSDSLYIVLTDGDNVIYAKLNENHLDEASINTSFEQFLQSTIVPIVQPKYAIAEGVYIFKNAIRKVMLNNQYRKDKQQIEKAQKLLSFLDGLNDNPITQEHGTFLFNESFEVQFFRLLLGAEEYEYIVKFSGERSMYHLLDHHTQNMCSLICMNDPQEMSYTSDYFRNSKNPVSDPRKDLKEEANNTFILSACQDSTEQELTMWRLYGDDARGVCIRYKVNKNKLNQKGFYLAPVSYGQSKNQHFELDIILSIMNSGFAFKNWYVWKHFFKSYDYKVEREIRLLYMPTLDANPFSPNDSKWFTDERTKIHAEMKLFKLEGNVEHPYFPLIVDTIFLGTRFPNKEINKEQFNVRFINTNIFTYHNRETVFDLSPITNYR